MKEEENQRSTSNVQRSTSKGNSGRQAAYDLEERLLAYAIRIVRLVEVLPQSRAGDHLGGQVLRSGTSPALNHGEAQAAESRKDFIHKRRICLKELRETRRTLRIIGGVPLTNDLVAVTELIQETEELIRIFFAAIRTAIKAGFGGANTESSRINEESPIAEQTDSMDPTREEFSEIDPLTGACTWTLDVERWTLDVVSDLPEQKEAHQ